MSGWRARLLVFATALAFYTATLAPTVQWGDFGGYQTRITLGELELAPQGHPLWNLLARPFTYLPFGDAAWRVNFSSAFFGALTLIVLFATLFRYTSSLPASLLATLALAVSHTFWTYAVVPKAYSLTLMLLSLVIWLLLRWRDDNQLWRVAVVGGLVGIGVMNHLIIITAAPAIALFLAWESTSTGASTSERLRAASRTMAVAGAALVLGILPYLWLLSSAPAESASTGGFVSTYLLKFFDLLAAPLDLLTGIALTVANLAYQFLLMIFVGAWGWMRLWRRDHLFAMLCLLIFLGDIAFVLIPTEPPVMMHWHLYHPAYLAFAYPVGTGIAELLARRRNHTMQVASWAAAIVLPAILAYFIVAPGVARALNITARLGVRDFPGRDSIAFLFIPSKAGDYGARTYGEQVLERLPRGAVLFADWTPYAALWYLHDVEHLRPDVTVYDLPDQEPLLDAVDRFRASGRPVYIADTSRYYDVPRLETRYAVEPDGLVYRLVPR